MIAVNACHLRLEQTINGSGKVPSPWIRKFRFLLLFLKHHTPSTLRACRTLPGKARQRTSATILPYMIRSSHLTKVEPPRRHSKDNPLAPLVELIHREDSNYQTVGRINWKPFSWQAACIHLINPRQHQQHPLSSWHHRHHQHQQHQPLQPLHL